MCPRNRMSKGSIGQVAEEIVNISFIDSATKELIIADLCTNPEIYLEAITNSTFVITGHPLERCIFVKAVGELGGSEIIEKLINELKQQVEVRETLVGEIERCKSLKSFLPLPILLDLLEEFNDVKGLSLANPSSLALSYILEKHPAVGIARQKEKIKKFLARKTILAARADTYLSEPAFFDISRCLENFYKRYHLLKNANKENIKVSFRRGGVKMRKRRSKRMQ